MSFIRHFALPLFGFALWFAVALAVLATFAEPRAIAQPVAAPEVMLVAPPVVVGDCCDCCDRS